MKFDICMVNPFFHPYDGGIERRMRGVGKGLSKKHDTHVVTSQLPGTESFEIVDGIRIHRLPSRFIDIYNPPAVFTRGIESKIREINPDVIHFHYRWSLQYTKAVISFMEKIPVVFTWHNAFGEGIGWQRPLSLINDDFFKHLLAKKCDKVICVSNYIKRQLSNRGIPEDIMKVIYNGIDLREPSKREEDFILFIGRLVHTKGIDVLVEAMEDVDTKLLVCGKGPKSEELGKAEGIELLGFVSEEKKYDLLRKCKFLVLPSYIESFGIVLLEAMTVGKPVVATKVGGIPEVVGDAGIIVPPKDPKKLSVAINRLASDDELRHKLARNAEKRISSFSWDRIALQIENVYKEVISGS